MEVSLARGGRFVTVGYASGSTVYRYSAEPVAAPPSALAPPVSLRLLADNAPLERLIPRQQQARRRTLSSIGRGPRG